MVEKEHAGHVIKKRLEELQMTQADLAEQAGVSPYAVTKWIQTGKLSRENTILVARLLEISMDELLSIKLIVHGDVDISEDEGKYFFVNKVSGPRLSAGNGSLVFDHEEIDNSHAFRTSWLRDNGYKKSRLKLFKVEGYSMSPTLEDGHVVLVNMDETAIKNGKVYAILVDDEARIKRLFRRSDGAVEIRSDNQSQQFPTETISADASKELNIIGRVVWSGGEM